MPWQYQSVVRTEAVKAELRRAYRARRLCNFKDAIRAEWYNPPTPFGAMVAPLTEGPLLHSSTVTQPVAMQPAALDICNKLTLVYWTLDAHENEDIAENYSTRAVCAAIWQMWTHTRALTRLDFGFYFARAFKLDSIPQYNEDIKSNEMVLRHGRLCNEATEALGDNPLLHNYKVLPLCRAIVTIVDHRLSDEAITAIRAKTGQSITQSKSLKEFGDTQTVLLLRTLNEEGLSAPIDFSSIATHARSIEDPWGESPVSSPISWPSIAIRVSLNTVINFVCDIQAREQQALPHFYDHLTNNTDRSKDPYLRLRNPTPSKVDKICMTEEVFLEEVYREGVYYDAGPKVNMRWIGGARKRARKKEGGVYDWADLENVTEWDSLWPWFFD